MQENNAEEGDIREELGLTEERGDELVRIAHSIMDQCSDEQGYVRTSHVLLQVAGRKDLSDVEKAACVFILAVKAGKPSEREKRERKMPDREDIPRDISGIMNFDMEALNGHISGMVVAPDGIELPELIAGIMAILISMIKNMPEEDAKYICRIASMSFARMALGDMGSRGTG